MNVDSADKLDSSKEVPTLFLSQTGPCGDVIIRVNSLQQFREGVIFVVVTVWTFPKPKV